MKNKVLFCAQLPDPIYGASLRNREFLRFLESSEDVEVNYVDIKGSNQISDIGKVNLEKIISFVKSYLRFIYFIIFKRPNRVYITHSANGVAFWKDFIYLLTSKVFLIKVVIHLRNRGFSKSPGRIKRFVMRKFFNKIKVLSLSAILNDDYIYFNESNEVAIVGNCIDEQDISTPDSSGSGIASKKAISVYHISNLCEDKGTLLILDFVDFILSERLSLRSNVKVTLIGPWTDKNCELKYRAMQEKYDDLALTLEWIGPLYGREKMNAIKGFDLHLFPTKYEKECFPGVILEAMAMGIPSIATDWGANRDMVEDRQTGMICEANVRSLYNKIFTYSSHIDLLKTHGRNAFDLHKRKFHSRVVLAKLKFELFN